MKKELLENLISISISLSDRERELMLASVENLDEEAQNRLIMIFQLEQQLIKKLPEIKGQLLNFLDETFDNTDKAFQKFERSVYQVAEKKQSEAELSGISNQITNL
jgi:hypothetical protein